MGWGQIWILRAPPQKRRSVQGLAFCCVLREPHRGRPRRAGRTATSPLCVSTWSHTGLHHSIGAQTPSGGQKTPLCGDQSQVPGPVALSMCGRTACGVTPSCAGACKLRPGARLTFFCLAVFGVTFFTACDFEGGYTRARITQNLNTSPATPKATICFRPDKIWTRI